MDADEKNLSTSISKVQPQTPLQESATPRRSTRKSIKPAQDYDEIIGKRHLRSAVIKDIDEEEQQDQKEPEAAQPKWTPAKVGRVSQKRGRKNRKAASTGVERREKKKEANDDSEKENINKLQIEDKISQEVTVKKEAKVTEVKEGKLIRISNSPIEKEMLETRAPQMVIDKEELQTHEVSSQKSENIEVPIEKKANFGSYLKSNDLNISDLGLIPLQDDDSVEEQVDNVSIKEETSEGTSLSSSAKQELEESVAKESSVEVVTINNDTFDKSDDCIEVTGLSEEQHHDEVEMQTLQISDDEEEEVPPPSKVPRIVVTDEQEVAHILLSTPRPMQASGTPKKRPTPYRFSTPYKRKEAFNFTATTENNEAKSENEISAEQSITLPLTTMEPKEIVLRSIRKRSLSVCVDGRNDQLRIRPPRNVTFHSPANQTVVFEKFDLLDARKDANSSKAMDNKDNYVTKRRKRSMSVDESMSRKMSRLPRPTVTASHKLTPTKQRQQTPQKAKAVPLRTKLPNFAAIHQKQFDKMENLIEHVTRKNERAKVLTSSAAKLLNSASAQKEARNQREQQAAGDGGKLKAVKKILLDISTTKQPPLPKPTLKDTNKYAENLYTEESRNEKYHKLPISKPFLKVHAEENAKDKSMVKKLSKTAIIKPLIGVIADVPKKLMQKSTPAKNTAVLNTVSQLKKPAFNLSTSINTTATLTTTTKKGFMSFPSAMQYKYDGGNTSNAVTSSSTSLDNKLLERRQRHMEMFKGRPAGSSTNSIRGGTVSADGSARNFGEIIRGVRSNRRFALQMQHRMNLENN